MTDDFDSAFVEIVARAAEVDAAAERLVPLYDAAAPEPQPAPPSAPHRLKGCSIALLIAIAVGAAVIALGATSSSPRPTDPIPSGVNGAY